MRPSIPQKHIDDIKQLTESGYTANQISERLNLGIRTIEHVRETHKFKKPLKIYKRACAVCSICFETSHLTQFHCSIYCAGLSRRKYSVGSPSEFRCYECGQVKPIDEFGIHKGKPTGRAYKCKKCRARDPKANLVRLAYEKRRRKDDLKFRLSNKMRSSIHISLKNNNSKNGRHWEDLVGYTWEKLKRHLQKQFQHGMSWDNYGEWHIDHIIPVNAFNFSKSSDLDFKRCWALKNLQPMWAEENMSKRDNLEKPFQPCLKLAMGE